MPRRNDVSSERIEAAYLTTHNWGKSAKFFQAPAFTLEFETDHNISLAGAAPAGRVRGRR
nr:hypothetical protein [Burkholderia vietnamiensis]